MEPISTALIIGLPILTKALGDALSGNDRAKADELRQQIYNLYGPEALEKAQQDAQVGQSAMGQVQADPQAVAAQRLALQRLQEDSSTIGLTAPERAEMGAAMDDAAQYERGQREAILQNAQARGMGGSGLELASLLQGQQGGAMRAHAAGRDAAAMAARRRALANMQLGQFGSQLRGQGFGEDADKARAYDAIAQFNANNRRGVGSEFRAGQASALDAQAASAEGHARDTSQTWAGVGAAGVQAVGSMYDPRKQKWPWED